MTSSLKFSLVYRSKLRKRKESTSTQSIPAGLVKFFFRLLLSGVAIADFPSPFVPIFCIIPVRHFNQCHVLAHCIDIPHFRLFPVPLSWRFHTLHPSPNYTHHLSSVHVHIQLFRDSDSNAPTQKVSLLALLTGNTRRLPNPEQPMAIQTGMCFKTIR